MYSNNRPAKKSRKRKRSPYVSKSLVKKLKALPFPERKRIVNNVRITDTEVYVSTTANIFNFGLINEGTDVNQRVGRQVTPTKFKLRGQVSAKDNNGSTNTIRIIVFQYWGDTRNGTFPEWADIMSINSGQDNTMQAFFDNDLQGQYSVLYDKQFTVSYGTRSIPVVMDLELKNQIWEFAANDSNAQNGNVTMFVVSDLNDNLADRPGFYFNSRIYYVDS